MKVTFVFPHLGFFRNFQETIALLLGRDIAVDVYCCRRHDTIRAENYDLIRSRPPGLAIFERDAKLPIGWAAMRLRFLRDILHYLRPELADNELYWQRLRSWRKRTWSLLLMIEVARRARWLGRSAPRRRLDAMLAAAERWLPVSRVAAAELERGRPDLVVVSPYVVFHAGEVEFVKAAQCRRIPTLWAVASWDNLVNKGVAKLPTDAVAVWNRHMAAEARDYHAVPERNIIVTGSPIFDVWFGRQPSMPRDAFFAKLGLEADRPTLLYLGSSNSIVGNHEERLFLIWLRRLRADRSHPASAANVIARPHPMNLKAWLGADFGDPRVALWPKIPVHPTDEASRNDFFDSIFHADAVIGINTSSMIEAAIVGRPVLCFSIDEAADAADAKAMDKRWLLRHQLENLHFRHLLESGFVQHAVGLGAHRQQLRAVFDTVKAASLAAAATRFVADFVRPLGLDVNASAALAERIEGLAKLRPTG